MSPGHCSCPLTILLITFLLLPSSSAYCPEKYSYQVCHQLYHLFEQALLASPPNLYKLREEYFPSSRSSPVYGHVGYNISYVYSTSFSYNTTPPCDGNHVNTPLLPIKHSKCIPWSSSAILAYIDPMYLNSFQINLLDRLFQNAGAVAANLSDCRNQYHQISSGHVHLQLLLHLQEELPCLPSEEQVSAVLEDLTSWLKAYAVSRSSQTVIQYSSYKGFSYTGATDNELRFVICAIYIFFALLMGAAMVYWAPICYKWIVEKAGNQKNHWYIFFWAASLVATVCNAAILVFETVHLSDVGPVYQFHIAKIVLVPSFCLLDLVLAICIIHSGLSTQKESTESPNSTKLTPESPNSTKLTPESPKLDITGTAGISKLDTTGTAGISKLDTTGTAGISKLDTTGTAGISKLDTTGTAGISKLDTTGTAGISKLDTTGTTGISTQQTQKSPQRALKSPDSTKEARLHVPKFAVILSRVLCCTFLCDWHNQETLVCLLALWSLMLFIHLLSLAVLPTMIWVFVLPLRIISLITSIGAILFCLTAAVAVFIYSIPFISISSQPQQSGINKCCSVCRVFCLVAIPPLFLAILVLGTIIYLQLIMTSIDTTSVAGIIASFLPTAALTIIGWLVTGRVLIGGVSGEGEGASHGTPHESDSGGRVYNFFKHPLQALRGAYHQLPQNTASKTI